jgi:hypothetical protein
LIVGFSVVTLPLIVISVAPPTFVIYAPAGIPVPLTGCPT